ncbi:hypothetical protein WDV06_20120 [Streptomyces racemochromogenes]|uniref:Uncharacterized protein n=1 Tax=Streptomyces racemochromogenes TaxID=67353 RepID=A0ABW7PG48_9ACTN
MPVQPTRPESSPAPASGMDVLPFTPSLVKTVFRGITSMHVSRPAACAAASVLRTVLTEIVSGCRRAAAEETRKKLLPADLVSSLYRNVEVMVGPKWYDHSPTFKGLNGVTYDAEGVMVRAPRRSQSRKPSAMVGAHRFEVEVRKLLRSQRVTAVPALVRDLDGLASNFLTDLARDAVMVVREGGLKRYGTVALVLPGEATPPASLKESIPALYSRTGDARTVGRDDILAATRIQLFGDIRQRAITEAHEATRGTSTV